MPDRGSVELAALRQLQILEIVRGLLARGCTIVVTLHDLNLAMRYGDRLVFLRDGSLRDVVEQPGDVSAELVKHIFDVNVTPLDAAGQRMLHFHL